MIENISSWFSWLFSQMEPSDWVNMIAILASTSVGIISVIIAILTLRQNNRMIEESSRPYVTVYSDCTFFQESYYYVIVKNFGNSGATITEFQTDKDLFLLACKDEERPFKHMVGTFIAPGQSFKMPFHLPESQKQLNQVKFDIGYKTSNKTYHESVVLNIDASSDLIMRRANSKDHELKIISYALQDLCEKHM